MTSRARTSIAARLVWFGVALSAGWLATPGSSAAQAVDCKREDLSMVDMNECASDDAKRADADLNDVYAELRKKIDAESQARLRDAQRTWIAFRDKECIFRTGGGMNQQGSIWPKLVLECTKDLTEARVRDLRQQLKCESWDLSCPAK